MVSKALASQGALISAVNRAEPVIDECECPSQSSAC